MTSIRDETCEWTDGHNLQIIYLFHGLHASKDVPVAQQHTMVWWYVCEVEVKLYAL